MIGIVVGVIATVAFVAIWVVVEGLVATAVADFEREVEQAKEEPL